MVFPVIASFSGIFKESSKVCAVGERSCAVTIEINADR